MRLSREIDFCLHQRVAVVFHERDMLKNIGKKDRKHAASCVDIEYVFPAKICGERGDCFFQHVKIGLEKAPRVKLYGLSGERNLTGA